MKNVKSFFVSVFFIAFSMTPAFGVTYIGNIDNVFAAFSETLVGFSMDNGSTFIATNHAGVRGALGVLPRNFGNSEGSISVAALGDGSTNSDFINMSINAGTATLASIHQMTFIESMGVPNDFTIVNSLSDNGILISTTQSAIATHSLVNAEDVQMTHGTISIFNLLTNELEEVDVILSISK